MLSNDAVLIDKIIDEILTNENSTRSDKRALGQVFEHFAISELLKTYDLADEEITHGITDGADDGGIDGVYIFVNGLYLSEATSFRWPKQNAKLEIYIISCKHDDSHKLAPLESMDSSLSELLDFRIVSNNLNKKYNDKVLSKRNLLYTAYRKLATQGIEPVINLRYISRGDTSLIAEPIVSAGDKLVTTCKIFANAAVSMKYWGAKELLSQYRIKRNKPIEFAAVRKFQLEDNCVALMKIKALYNVVTDDEGNLKKYLFDANVRDYLGENRTNKDILESLSDEDNSLDFWLLNNGITMIASNITVFDNDVIEVEDAQIVNGLQTTVAIYNHFSSGNVEHSEDHILIKIMKSVDYEVTKQIVRATNNQSAMPVYALYANDKIQKDIEAAMLANGLYYERRPNYYTNLGYDTKKIITPLYLASGYISLVHKLPNRALRIKGKFMDNREMYERVFNESININIWHKIAHILLKSDSVSGQFRSINRKMSMSTDGYLKTMRSLVPLVTVARTYGGFSYSASDLISLNIDDIDENKMKDVVEHLISFITEKTKVKFVSKLPHKDINNYLREAADIYQLSDVASILNRRDVMQVRKISSRVATKLDNDFIEKLKHELTKSPAEKGIHKNIAATLGCSNNMVLRAIKFLIKSGEYENSYYQQFFSEQ